MLAGGAAGLLAVAGLAFIGREAARKRRRKQAEAKASRPLVGHREVTIPAVDVEVARERALALLNDLSHVSREGLSRARIALHDVDVERAREGAEDVLAALGERTRHAPAATKKPHLARPATDHPSSRRTPGSPRPLGCWRELGTVPISRYHCI